MSEYYIQLPLETDPQDILDEMFEYIKSKVPGWEPSQPNLDTLLLQAFAIQASDLREAASSVPISIFRYFGNSLVGIPPIDSSPATITTAWTMRDNAGYTIQAGTLVGLRTTGDELITFEIVDTFVIPPGSTTAAGKLAIATTPGAAASGLGSAGADIELVEPILDFVILVEQEGISTGGVDAESDIDYLSRLRTEMQLLSPRPILPMDFSVLAVRIAGVERALTIDGLNVATGTLNNERMVGVFAIDEAGEDVSAPVKSDIDALLESEREINFDIGIGSPTYTTIDVDATVRRKVGFDSAVVDAAVTEALTEYLFPGNWGRQDLSGDVAQALPVDWVDQRVIRHYELISVADAVEGVDYVDTLTFRTGAGAYGTANINMTGQVALPRAGAIAVTVTAP